MFLGMHVTLNVKDAERNNDVENVYSTNRVLKYYVLFEYWSLGGFDKQHMPVFLFGIVFLCDLKMYFHCKF